VKLLILDRAKAYNGIERVALLTSSLADPNWDRNAW
jgi:hypothetical protein